MPSTPCAATRASTPTNCRIGEIGQLDVVHLGMGADGHTASLFPASPALDADPGQLVSFNEDPSGRNKHPRMTLTYAGIARARLVIFTVAGEAKRPALEARAGRRGPPRGPGPGRAGALARRPAPPPPPATQRSAGDPTARAPAACRRRPVATAAARAEVATWTHGSSPFSTS